MTQPNQVWASDSCYIPMTKGVMSLTVILDWYSRRVLAWQVSNRLDAASCVEALHEALKRYDAPMLFTTAQGAQYTSEAFTSILLAQGRTIRMDGKGRGLDNVFVKRLWRSVRSEDSYRRAYESPAALRVGLPRYFSFYRAPLKTRIFS